MNTPTDLHPAVRIEGELIVITEDNVTLSQDDVANILIELHRRGADLNAAFKEAGIQPSTLRSPGSMTQSKSNILGEMIGSPPNKG